MVSEGIDEQRVLAVGQIFQEHQVVGIDDRLAEQLSPGCRIEHTGQHSLGLRFHRYLYQFLGNIAKLDDATEHVIRLVVNSGIERFEGILRQ